MWNMPGKWPHYWQHLHHIWIRSKQCAQVILVWCEFVETSALSLRWNVLFTLSLSQPVTHEKPNFFLVFVVSHRCLVYHRHFTGSCFHICHTPAPIQLLIWLDQNVFSSQFRYKFPSFCLSSQPNLCLPFCNAKSKQTGVEVHFNKMTLFSCYN